MNIRNTYTLYTIACFLTACSNSGTNGIEFENATLQKNTPLTKDADTPQCRLNLSIDYAKSGKAKVDKEINNSIEQELFGLSDIGMKAAIDSFANQYAKGYTKSLAPLYRADKADKEKRSWYEYKYTVKTETANGRKGITVYKANIDYYEGGAHGISLQTVMNFDNATGRRLTLDDVFVKGSENRLAEALLKALEDKTGKKGIDELKADGYLCTTDIYAPQNFALGTDDITFVYNVYEIAPYEKGPIELTVSYGDVEELLTERK